MVTWYQKFRVGPWVYAVLAVCLMAADEGKRPLERLDPLSRAKVFAALVGLIILGLAMIALIYLGARMTRRYMHGSSSLPVAGTDDARRDDWAATPLVPSETRPDDSDDL